MRILNDAQDIAALHSWIQSLDRATTVLTKSGGTADFSRESVGRFWSWIQPQCTFGPYYNSTDDPLDIAPDTLPEWAKTKGHQRIRKLANISTLELMSHLARYYGECLRKAVPEAQWIILKDSDPRPPQAILIGGNEPSLVIPLTPQHKYGATVSPIHLVSILVMRTVTQSQESTDILTAYDRDLQELKQGVLYAAKQAHERA
ncbi:MAG TPA: hypothetical protein VLE73_04100 [Candidatus Saccharimonadales bacterium]|nr:hypothetical protein [Candidatus Saccharimonadales bacterium]